MRKLTKILLAGLMAFSMTGCQTTTENVEDNNGKKNDTVNNVNEALKKEENEENTNTENKKEPKDETEYNFSLEEHIDTIKDENKGSFDNKVLDNKLTVDDLNSRLEIDNSIYESLEGYESADGKSLVVMIKPLDGHELDCDKALTNYAVKKAEMKVIPGNEKNDFKEDEELVVPEHMMMVLSGTYVFALGDGAKEMVNTVVNTLHESNIESDIKESDKDTGVKDTVVEECNEPACKEEQSDKTE